MAKIGAMFLGAILEAQSQPFVPPPSMMCRGFQMANPRCRACPHAMPHFFKSDECHTKEHPQNCGGSVVYCVPVEFKLKLEE